MKWIECDNRQGSVALGDIPVLEYADFYDTIRGLLDDPARHIFHYFALSLEERFRLVCLVADDRTGKVLVLAYDYEYYCEQELPSLTAIHPQVHPFEREIAESNNIVFAKNPWAKPLRTAFPDDYPFYKMEGDMLHEVHVGPVHAGIIEPGGFRFICQGEKVLHLEIALGYQHRGVEELMVKARPLRRSVLSEAIAGDSSIAHATASAMLAERLAGVEVPQRLWAERTIALEMERIAMHIADTGALCMDIGYQLGQVACEALRTVVINTMQLWCGNRFGRSLIRPAGTNCPLTPELSAAIAANLADVARRYTEVADDLKDTPSVLARFEECGVVTREQMQRIGAVGMAARASGLGRDLRTTHPWGIYGKELSHDPVVKEFGDVMARCMVRVREVRQSVEYIAGLLAGQGTGKLPGPDYALKLKPGTLAFAALEGWRGECVHVAATDEKGELISYKVKDPSVHNWMALALAVRGAGISDFPVCNKSFNLSYCGHDL